MTSIRSIPLLLASLLWLAAPSSHATVILTQFLFDDFRDSFDTTLLVPASKSPGLVEVSRNVPFRTVTDTLTTPSSAGATRTLEMSIDPAINTGDITVFVDNTGFTSKPSHFSIGADTETAGSVVLDYNFSPIGLIDPGNGNSHIELNLLLADKQSVSGSLEFRDLDGTVTRHQLESELNVNLSQAGSYVVPFSAYPDINFNQITGMRLQINPGPSYDVEINYVAGVLVIPSIPEPSALLLLALAAGSLFGIRRRPG